VHAYVSERIADTLKYKECIKRTEGIRVPLRVLRVMIEIHRNALQPTGLTGAARAKRAVPIETWWVFSAAWRWRAPC
jgi:hypothetical protein